jgi:hypothetical protein
VTTLFGSMGKSLPILGILGAVFAMLSALVLVNAAVFIVIPVAVTGSIVLMAQRNALGAVAGLIVLLLGLVAGIGLVGSIGTENGSLDFGISSEVGRAWAILACLAIPMGALAVRWTEFQPRWLAYASAGVAAVAALMGILLRADLTDQGNVSVLVLGVLLLLPIVPMASMLRNPAA